MSLERTLIEESCIVHDIKLENYKLTSNYRASIGHKIFVFNPLDSKCETHRYNPLDFISFDDKQKVNDIQKIADLLIEGNGATKILFIGLVLYLSATNRTKTIGEIARMLNRNLEQELLEGLKTIDQPSNEYCFKILSGFLGQSKDYQRNLINELRMSLYLWDNPLVDYATSHSDFDIALLKTSKVTIYVGLNPTDINRLQPLMQLFYNHVFERLISTSQFLGNSDKNGGVTIILDDFYTVGKLERYAFAYLRGYKVRLFAISSDIPHIEELYGKRETLSIISDCAFKVFFASNDYKTAQHISSLCIDKNKELMSWQEIMNLPQDSQILLLNKEQPVICKKMKYYENEALKQRIM